MDVILMAGGYGTRLEPISLFIPKALLPVGGRPLIDHIVDELCKYSEVERIIIDTNKKFIDQFEYYVKSKRVPPGKKLELLVEPTMHNGEKLGQIKGIEYALKNANISSDFMIVATDNYFDFSLKQIIKHFEKSKRTTLGLYETNSMDLLTRSGVVSLKGNTIVELEEKPAKPKSNLLSIGIYIFPKASAKLFAQYIKENTNHDSVGWFVKWLVKKERTESVVCKGTWIDMGTIDAYKKVFEIGKGK